MSRARAAPIVVAAHAKLNLALAVGPPRADGFHDLATVFQSVSLADTLVIEPRRRGFSLAIRHEHAAARGRAPSTTRVPAGPDNLVLRAARALAARVRPGAGARFTLVKRIPERAGMGGGSADAAAALVGLERLWGIRLPRAERMAIALELGSDVPFALTGGTALGHGRGERLKKLDLAPFRAVIAVPRWRISTARAFSEIDRRKYHLTAWRSKLRSAQILGREEVSVIRWMRLGNDFETVLGTRRSEFLSLSERLRRAGAAEVRMTGSGSAVFGVLGPGVSDREVVGRFTGSESLFLVRSTRSGPRPTTLR